ncbi:DUF47 domain-containing protein [Fusibacter tunisiensis]|uniref:Phosphate transport protein (TIGR00153 family) n=1 Tax=Fusibacter tunisiensis TaxID=1008308 RepID=A0ABS2MP43_9FIRM|nr:DUF47 family protein [Fusibacter tunisiensis]MBM7561181.1 putative phosphate transport protein (TIGR00153 family) [Fusibacter tunisiensis]
MKVFKDRNKELEQEINLYLETLKGSALVFQQGLSAFLEDEYEGFENKLGEIINLEKEADGLLRALVQTLYKYNLMPDLSADILELMTALDEISDISKSVLLDLNVEKFQVLEMLKPDFMRVADTSSQTVHHLLGGIRAFFENPTEIDGYIHTVRAFESEVDQMEYVLKQRIFALDILDFGLCDKMHLRDLAHKIASLSDECERIADLLAVLKFKRTI